MSTGPYQQSITRVINMMRVMLMNSPNRAGIEWSVLHAPFNTVGSPLICKHGGPTFLKNKIKIPTMLIIFLMNFDTSVSNRQDNICISLFNFFQSWIEVWNAYKEKGSLLEPYFLSPTFSCFSFFY